MIDVSLRLKAALYERILDVELIKQPRNTRVSDSIRQPEPMLIGDCCVIDPSIGSIIRRNAIASVLTCKGKRRLHTDRGEAV